MLKVSPSKNSNIISTGLGTNMVSKSSEPTDLTDIPNLINFGASSLYPEGGLDKLSDNVVKDDNFAHTQYVAGPHSPQSIWAEHKDGEFGAISEVIITNRVSDSNAWRLDGAYLKFTYKDDTTTNSSSIQNAKSGEEISFKYSDSPLTGVTKVELVQPTAGTFLHIAEFDIIGVPAASPPVGTPKPPVDTVEITDIANLVKFDATSLYPEGGLSLLYDNEVGKGNYAHTQIVRSADNPQIIWAEHRDGEFEAIHKIDITNRSDSHGARLDGAYLRLTFKDGTTINEDEIRDAKIGQTISHDFSDDPLIGVTKVELVQPTVGSFLHIAEFDIVGVDSTQSQNPPIVDKPDPEPTPPSDEIVELTGIDGFVKFTASSNYFNEDNFDKLQDNKVEEGNFVHTHIVASNDKAQFISAKPANGTFGEISEIVIYNRTDADVAHRLNGAYVQVIKSDGSSVNSDPIQNAQGSSKHSFKFNGNELRSGESTDTTDVAEVRLVQPKEGSFLHISEFDIFGRASGGQGDQGGQDGQSDKIVEVTDISNLITFEATTLYPLEGSLSYLNDNIVEKGNFVHTQQVAGPDDPEIISAKHRDGVFGDIHEIKITNRSDSYGWRLDGAYLKFTFGDGSTSKEDPISNARNGEVISFDFNEAPLKDVTKVELVQPTKGSFLHIAEFDIFGKAHSTDSPPPKVEPTSLIDAYGPRINVFASSEAHNGDKDAVIDGVVGVVNDMYHSDKVTVLNPKEWIEVGIPQGSFSAKVHEVVITNRNHQGNGGELNGAKVELIDQFGEVVATRTITNAFGGSTHNLTFDGIDNVGAVRVSTDQIGQHLQLDEIDILTKDTNVEVPPILPPAGGLAELTERPEQYVKFSASSAPINGGGAVHLYSGTEKPHDFANLSDHYTTDPGYLNNPAYIEAKHVDGVFGGTIHKVVITNIYDEGRAKFLKGASLIVKDSQGKTVYTSQPIEDVSRGSVHEFDFNNWPLKDIASIRLEETGNDRIAITGFEIFGSKDGNTKSAKDSAGEMLVDTKSYELETGTESDESANGGLDGEVQPVAEVTGPDNTDVILFKPVESPKVRAVEESLVQALPDDTRSNSVAPEQQSLSASELSEMMEGISLVQNYFGIDF